MDEERARGVTIQSAIAGLSWKNWHFNIFDTPGHADFAFEVEKVLPALDFCILLIDSSKGIETQTKTVIRLARQNNLPIVCFANKIDKFNSNFTSSMASLTKFNLNPLPVILPKADNAIISMVDHGEDDFFEQLATYDDEFAEKYLEDAYDDKDVYPALSRIFFDKKATLVLCGSAKQDIGVTELLDFVVHINEHNRNNEISREYAYVFKITNLPKIGQITMLRNFDLEKDSPQVLFKNYSSQNFGLRRSPMYAIQGNDLVPVTKLSPNQVLAISGKQDISTGDYVGFKRRSMKNVTRRVNSACSVTLEVINNTERRLLIKTLEILVKEDPSLSFDIDENTDDIILKGIGRFHLEIAISRLKTEHKIKNIITLPFQVVYKETPLHEQQFSRKLSCLSGEDGEANFDLKFTITPFDDEELIQFTQEHVKIEHSNVGIDHKGAVKSINVTGRKSVSTEEVCQRIIDGVYMAMMIGPLRRSTVVNTRVTVNKLVLCDSNENGYDHIKGIHFIRMIINAIRDANKQMDFDILEPEVSFEISLYRDRNNVIHIHQYHTRIIIIPFTVRDIVKQ